LSENSESEQKEKEKQQQQQQQSSSSETKQENKSPEASSESSTTQVQQKPKTAPPVGVPRPTSTPVGTPRPPSTPVGTPVGTPRPTSTPIGRPVGTPVGAQRPSVGTPVARPGVGAPTAATPSGPLPPKTPPSKPPESKVEVSRRNFIRGLAIIGGLAVVASYVPLFPYLQGSVGAQSLKDQQLVLDPDTSPTTPITPGSVGNGIAFTYPYTGNPNVDSDTFVQCVLIKIPSGMTLPSGYDQYAAKDSSGNLYMAFSRVCVHLWCLWGTGINTTDSQVGGPVLGPCPCHGSTYVPASGGKNVYPHFAAAQNQVPGQAVAGPASLQPFPNNQLPIIKIRIASDGTFHAYGRVGQIGYCQQC
jgi:Rieske Fe-S protein